MACGRYARVKEWMSCLSTYGSFSGIYFAVLVAEEEGDEAIGLVVFVPSALTIE